MSIPEKKSPKQQIDLSLFAAAVNATCNGVVITDHSQPDEPIIYCNYAFEKLSGYTKEEIIGKNCRFLQGNDRDQPEKQIIKKAVEDGEECIVQLKNYRKDGTLFWNELVLSPVKNDAGIVTHFIGIQNDITQRKTAELELQQERDSLEERVHIRTRELEESEEYMTSIVETVRESLVVLDEDLKILSVNEHFCRFFDLTAQEVIGLELFEIGDGQWNIAELKDLLKHVLPANNPFEGFQIENEFKEIGKKSLVVNARQITLKGKYLNRILLAIEDLTEQQEIERRKEDFISIASHEMKTPLTTIKGNVQLMQRKAMRNNDDTYTASLNSTIKAIERLDKLINDLLDVARIQSGTIQLNITVFSLNDLITEAVQDIQERMSSHQIEITSVPDVNMEGDFSRLQQVVIHLLSNAIKFSPKAQKVSLAIRQTEEQVEVAITDAGVGIDPADQRRIFDRFYRSHKIQERFQGVGVGLYICKQIIEEHHGQLWVESEEDKGSTFYFTLPLKQL